MNLSAYLPFLLAVAMLLALVAGALLVASGRLRRRSGVPQGEIVYEDASGLAREPLVSRRLLLSGKPDYLLKGSDGSFVPVEVKSGAAPRGGTPYLSHQLQVAAYFLLIEDVLDGAAPYGLIRYRDRTLRVANTEALRARLQETIDEMRELLAQGEAHRDHEQAQRCRRCSMAHACDERLV